MPGLPLVARIDGRSFSRFTSGMRRPFDQEMADLMVETAKYVVSNVSGARVAMTQSDEINVVIDPFGTPSAAEVLRRLEGYLANLGEDEDDCGQGTFDGGARPDDDPGFMDRHDFDGAREVDFVETTAAVRGWIEEIRASRRVPEQAVEFMFGGRLFKLTSVIAAMATARFLTGAVRLWPDRCARQLPLFDCRVFEVPSREEAVNVLLWREADATKNAVSMAARAHFPHSRLQGKSGSQMREMLMLEHGVNFDDYPARFKRGAYVQRRTVARELDASVLSGIPEGRRPSGPVFRNETVVLDMPPLRQVPNRVEVLLDGAEPVRG
jgi:tRNA(His) 5'-end guanylyltransferase